MGKGIYYVFIFGILPLCLIVYCVFYLSTYGKVNILSMRNQTLVYSTYSTRKHIFSGSTRNTITSPPNISEAFRNTHFMTISGNGRLGNRMFQFAALLGTCYRHGYTPYIRRSHMLNSYFQIDHSREMRMTNVATVGERGAGFYDTNLEKLSHTRNYTLGGYYQSWRYFDFISDAVRKSFIFKSSFVSKVNEFNKIHGIQDRIRVAIHVRRSDMASRRELSRGYNVATKEFFTKALQYFRTNFHDPVFIVLSDDMNWCRSNIQGNDVKYARTGNAGGDLALMAHCNHAVVSSGSFGWWGAYLTGGTVVFYNNYPARGSWLSKQYNKTDYYPSSWIPME